MGAAAVAAAATRSRPVAPATHLETRVADRCVCLVLAGFAGLTLQHPGWKSDITHCRTFEELPKAAQEYIGFLEDLAEVPVAMIALVPIAC